ncbi:type II toxin-antitoxin system HicA family toxin [Acinetobacter brisouii]|uniref:type II toxin-antitoxin system HicA family toxin n=1 Tax=Acinetobacter brisouii TaxID=396323 RepID=UPI00124C894F|nr:type II toxin-antitoxin system HicA family toxin [Acinetobacter brisouii]
MRLSTNKQIERTAKQLIKGGWSCRRGASHAIIKDPTTGYSLPIPGSPSCDRAALNWHNAVRKIQRGVRP